MRAIGHADHAVLFACQTALNHILAVAETSVDLKNRGAPRRVPGTAGRHMSRSTALRSALRTTLAQAGATARGAV